MTGDIGSQQYMDMHIALGASVMFWGRLEGRMKFLLSALTGAKPEVGHVLTANLTVAQMLDVGLHLIDLTCTEGEAEILTPWIENVKSLNERRNKLLHRGWEQVTKAVVAEDGSSSQVLALAQITLRSRKRGLQFHGEEVTLAELQQWGQDILAALGGMSSFPDRFSLKNLIRIPLTQPPN
jgi:hypothetical protein